MPFFLSMIRPTLECYVGVWGSCGEVNSGTLETLQKRVGRIVIETSSSDTATKALEWPRLWSRCDELIQNVLGNVYMVGALSILRTTLFLTRTFVLIQPARAISCICLL